MSNITSEAESIVSELANDYANAEQEISKLEKPNPKQTLIYVAGNVSFYQFAKDCADRGGVNSIGPQVYSLDNNGNITQNLSSTYPYSDTNFAKNCRALGIDVVPLIAAGSGLGSSFSDLGIQVILENPSPLQRALLPCASKWGTITFNLTLRLALPLAIWRDSLQP